MFAYLFELSETLALPRWREHVLRSRCRCLLGDVFLYRPFWIVSLVVYRWPRNRREINSRPRIHRLL